MNKKAKINKLIAKWKNCTKCELCEEREQVVFYRGNLDARVVVIGEAPGINEDKKGISLVGKSGELLNDLCKKARLSKDELAIVNCVGCRPPENRNPSVEEFWACKDRLYGMISIIKPKAILLIGGVPLGLIAKGKKEGITKDRGKILSVEFKWKNKSQKYLAVPTFHPAFLLRNRKQELERLAISDITKVMELSQDASYIERNDY